MTTAQYNKFIIDEQIEESNHFDLASEEVTVNSSWNYLKDAKLQNINTIDNITFDTINECGTSGIYDEDVLGTKAFQETMSTSRDKMFNANYLVGKTAVCIILPESDGSTENWTIDEGNLAVSQIILAYDKLSELAKERNIDVTWVYEIHKSVSVKEEPIEHVRPYFQLALLNWAFGWMDDALKYINPDITQWDALFENANRLRKQYKTDWGLTYFMVKNSPGVYFPNDALGYTVRYNPDLTNEKFSAPFAVSVYNRYGDPNTANQTVAHETLHIYGAPDEYGGTSTCNSDCDQSFGFLYHENGNCESCISTQTNCIMIRSGFAYNLCEHTLKHIGWSDSDNDGHPDAIDNGNASWINLYNMQLGDRVTITTSSGATVRVISATDNKMALPSVGTSNIIHYDCLNYQSQDIDETSLYYYSINDNPPSTFTPNMSDPSVIPNISTISYSAGTKKLTWGLYNSFAYVDVEIWRTNSCTGEEEMVAKPEWNKFHMNSSTPNKTIDVSNLDCDPCIAKFQAWRPDGANSPVVEYQFNNSLDMLDWDGDAINDECDNCPTVTNSLQIDTNNDGIGDACTYSCNDSENWEVTIGRFDNKNEMGKDIIQNSLGEYIVIGSSEYFGVGRDDLFISKTDGCGNLIWTHSFYGVIGTSGITLSDNSIVVVGYTSTMGNGGADFYLMKLDQDGNKIWEKTFGGSENDVAFSIVQTSDLGFALAGYTLSEGAGGYDCYLVKTDVLGNLLWSKTFGGTNYDFARSIIQTNDGGFAIAGYTNSFWVGIYNHYLIKTDSQGNLEWENHYGLPSYDFGYDVKQTFDNGFVIVGSSGTNGTDMYLVKTDALGVQQWAKRYGGDQEEVGYSVELNI